MCWSVRKKNSVIYDENYARQQIHLINVYFQEYIYTHPPYHKQGVHSLHAWVQSAGAIEYIDCISAEG